MQQYRTCSIVLVEFVNNVYVLTIVMMKKAWNCIIFCFAVIALEAQEAIRIPVRQYNADNGLLQNTVYDVTQDNAGFLWISTVEGVQRFDGYSFFEVKSSSGESFKTTHFKKDKFNNIWLFHSSGVSFYDDEHGIIKSILPDTVSSSLLASKQQLSTNTNKVRLKSNFLISSIDNVYLYDSLTGRYLVLMREDGTKLVRKGEIEKLFKDRLGNVWIATNAEGLLMYPERSSQFKKISSPKEDENFVRSIYHDQLKNETWTGLFNNGIIVYDSIGQVKEKYPVQLFPGSGTKSFPLINAIYPLQNNRMIGWGNYGSIFILDKTTREIKEITGEFIKQVNAFFGVVVSSGYWLSQIIAYDNHFIFTYGEFVIGISFNERNQIKIDKVFQFTGHRLESLFLDSNNLWIGAVGHYFNINLLNNKIDSFFLKKDCLIKSMCCSKDLAWLGTEDGIYITSNGIIRKHLRMEEGLPDNVIYCLQPDKNENIWCSSNRGLFYINTSNYHIKKFGLDDGLQSNEFNTGAFYKSTDNEFFFGGVHGTNRFYPDKILSYERSRVQFTAVLVGDSLYRDSVAPWNKKKITLPYSSNIISFQYCALNFSTPGLNHYQYSMEGIDPGWIDAGNTRFARYVLKPGSYSFRVKLEGESSPVTEIQIVITPPFWARWWFYCLIIIGAGAFLFLIASMLNKIKYEKRIRELQWKQKVQIDRERISKDLHDSLGAQATAIYFSAGNIGNGEAGENQNLVSTIKSTSQQMLSSLRETIWALNKQEMLLEEISDKLKLFVKQLNRHYPGVKVHFHEEVSGQRKLGSQQSLHLLRILQEAVNNAFKHAECRNIYCLIDDSDVMLRVQIQDDGKGFQESNDHKMEPDGNGLKNMHQRATEAGMLLEVKSDLNEGTSIVLTLRS